MRLANSKPGGLTILEFSRIKRLTMENTGSNLFSRYLRDLKAFLLRLAPNGDRLADYCYKVNSLVPHTERNLTENICLKQRETSVLGAAYAVPTNVKQGNTEAIPTHNEYIHTK